MSRLILDGKIVACDQMRETETSRKRKEIDARYSRKANDFGGLIKALIARRPAVDLRVAA
jgi:hypothetical protein